MHACIHTYIHTCIHTYIHTYIPTYRPEASENEAPTKKMPGNVQKAGRESARYLVQRIHKNLDAVMMAAVAAVSCLWWVAGGSVLWWVVVGCGNGCGCWWVVGGGDD